MENEFDTNARLTNLEVANLRQSSADPGASVPRNPRDDMPLHF
ncbi:hypothetical protein [Rhodoferax sp.]|nr:hypothetical protein [Rhodoferax sp.]